MRMQQYQSDQQVFETQTNDNEAELRPNKINNLQIYRQRFKQQHNSYYSKQKKDQKHHKTQNQKQNKTQEHSRNKIQSLNNQTNYSKTKINLFNNENVQQIELEPWSQNDFEIIDYHKFKQSSKKNNKFRNVNNYSPSKTSLLHKIHNNEEQCKVKSTRYRTQINTDQNHNQNQNTYTTSFQQQLKWRVQMGIMMQKRKRMSDLLKARHFGHIKSHAKKFNNKNSTIMNTHSNHEIEKHFQTIQSSCKGSQQYHIIADTIDQARSSFTTKFKSDCYEQDSSTLQFAKQFNPNNLYSAIKSMTKSYFNKRPFMQWNPKFQKEKAKSQNKSNINLDSQNSLQRAKESKRKYQNNQNPIFQQPQHSRHSSEFNFNESARGSVNLKKLSNKFSAYLLSANTPNKISCIDNSADKNRKLLSNKNLSLTKTCYLGNSVKNRMQIKSKHKLAKEKPSNVDERPLPRSNTNRERKKSQNTIEIPCIMKISPQKR